jgi:hypothetical protein
MSLSPQQLGQLIPLAPTLMAWLRQVDRKAGDLFLQDSSADLVEVTQTLRELLNALNYNGDLTMVQVRYICEAHDPTVWASAVRYILTSSEPKLVSEKIGSALVGSLPKLDGAKNASDCCKILGPLLDMLPRTHYQVSLSIYLSIHLPPSFIHPSKSPYIHLNFEQPADIKPTDKHPGKQVLTSVQC